MENVVVYNFSPQLPTLQADDIDPLKHNLYNVLHLM